MSQAIATLLLCGGRSRRMGRDKAGLGFVAQGRHWVLRDWMQARWSEVCSPVLCVGPIPAEQTGLSSWVQDDPTYAGQGPLAGLYSGLQALRAQVHPPAWTMLIAVDMPGFDPAWVDMLAQHRARGAAAIRFGPTPRASLLGALLSVERTHRAVVRLLSSQERRLQALDRALQPLDLRVPQGAAPEDLRSAINDPEDFARWLARCGYTARAQ